jgi:hypothetical protein
MGHNGTPAIIINALLPEFSREATIDTIRHEFGHVLGILHPFGAARYVEAQSQACTSTEIGHLKNKDNPGIMSYDEPLELLRNLKPGSPIPIFPASEPSWYDEGSRDYVRGHPLHAIKP